MRLPNSKIEIDLPLIGYYPLRERPDAGLQPDILIEPDVRDIARGIDTEAASAKAAFAGQEIKPFDKRHA